MNDNRKLNDQEIKNVSGGGLCYNKYPKEAYHMAGFKTTWARPFNWFDGCILRLSEDVDAKEIKMDECDPFIDYYLSHTTEEYIKYVQQFYPQYTRIIRGYDI